MISRFVKIKVVIELALLVLNLEPSYGHAITFVACGNLGR